MLLGGLAAPAPARADGITVRLGVGPGFAAGEHDVGDAGDTGGGVAANTELAIGTRVTPRLIAGVGTFPMVVPAPSYDDRDAGGHHVSATGPFVDFYVRPPRGAHVQAAALVVAGYHEAQDGHDGAVGFGAGAMLGAGYDLRLGARWNVGPLARATYYHWSGGDYTFDLVSTAVLIAFTRR